jgi:hypothetical protein
VLAVAILGSGLRIPGGAVRQEISRRVYGLYMIEVLLVSGGRVSQATCTIQTNFTLKQSRTRARTSSATLLVASDSREGSAIQEARTVRPGRGKCAVAGTQASRQPGNQAKLFR